MKIRNLFLSTAILSATIMVNSYANDSITVYADIVGKADPAHTDGKLLRNFSKTQSLDLSTSANMDVNYSATPNFSSETSIELFIHGEKVDLADLPRESRSKNIILSTDQLGTDTYAYVKNALYVWDENEHKLTPRDMKVKLLGQDLTDSGVTTISVGLDKSNFLAVGGGYQVAQAGNYLHMNYQFIDPATSQPVDQKIHIGYQDVDFNEGIKIANSAIDSIYVHNNSRLPYDLTSDDFLAVTHDYLDYSDKQDSASEPNHVVQFHLDVPKDGLNIDINTSRIKTDKYYAGSQVVPSNLKQLNYMGYQTTNFVDVDGNVISDPTYQDGLAGTNWNTNDKSILGYRLVPDKTIGQNYGQYINGVNTEVTYVYEKETPVVKQGDLVVNYVDKDGNKLTASETSTGNVDTEYTTSSKSIPGYKLVETPNNATGSYVEGTTTVTYVYEKETPVVKQGDLVVNYVDKDGNKLTASETSTGNVDTEYTTSSKSIPGYKLVETPNNATGSYVEGTTTVTYVYEKETPVVKQGDLVVNYVDKDGNKLTASETSTGNVDTEYTTSSKSIPGYKLVETPNNATGSYVEGTTTVTYVYEKETPVVKQGDLVVNYVDKDGNKLTASETSTGNVDTEYTTSSKSIPGYKLVETPNNATGSYVEGTTTVTYVYEKETPVVKQGDLVVNYVDKDGNKLTASETSTGNVDTEYTTSSKSIPGYKLVETPNNATGSYVEGTTTVTYVYEKETPVVKQGDLVVNYVDKDGNKLTASETSTGNVDTEYTTSSKSIPGYKLVETPNNATGSYVEGTTTVTYVYEKETLIPNTSELTNHNKTQKVVSPQENTSMKNNEYIITNTDAKLPNTAANSNKKALIITTIIAALTGVIMFGSIRRKP